MILYIREEYGATNWLAEMSDDEYQQLIERWETLRGLNCLVPVNLIVPRAKKCQNGQQEYLDAIEAGAKLCHFHESVDSFLEGTDYIIPEDKYFWMDGLKYDMSLFKY